MMRAMSVDFTKRSKASGNGRVYNWKGRRLRLFVGLTAIFVVGVALGAMLGSWFADPDMPTAQVALRSAEMPYAVPVRVYRPPVRTPGILAAPSSAEPAPVPPVAPKFVRPAPRAEVVINSVEPIPRLIPRSDPINPKPPAVTRIGPTKKQTWLANAVAAPVSEGRAMIALVIDDLGLSQARARRTIALPAPLTLAYLPYGHSLPKLAAESRRAGHELIIHVNMEPKDHDVDPGPKALLTSLDAEELEKRLEWALTRFDGYIGISNHMGSRFTEWPDGMEVVVRVLKRHGLLYFDSVTSTKTVGPALARAHGLVHASRDVFLDHNRDAAAVARQLAKAERIARRRGYAIAIGHPHDVTLEALKSWIPAAMKRGFMLVPLSAIVRRRLGEG